MYLNIIDAPALFSAMDEVLEKIDEPLRSWRPQLTACLRRAIISGQRPSIARRRKSDPEWAQRAFDRKERLYRLGPCLTEAIDELSDLLESFASVAQISGDAAHPMQHEARRFFRSLPHWKPEAGGCGYSLSDSLHDLIEAFLERADRAWCRSHRYDSFGKARTISAGRLTGTRCKSIAEITALGREARNCLAEIGELHLEFTRGRHDIWALRTKDRLLAVLRIELDPVPMLAELLGPRNDPGISGYGPDLLDWLRATDFTVGPDCHIRVADFLPQHMRAQRHEDNDRELLRSLMQRRSGAA